MILRSKWCMLDEIGRHAPKISSKRRRSLRSRCRASSMRCCRISCHRSTKLSPPSNPTGNPKRSSTSKFNQMRSNLKHQILRKICIWAKVGNSKGWVLWQLNTKTTATPNQQDHKAATSSSRRLLQPEWNTRSQHRRNLQKSVRPSWGRSKAPVNCHIR